MVSKSITTSKGEFVVAELPKGVKHIELSKDSEGVYLCWHDGNASLINDDFSHGEITLSKNPKDSFKLICKLSEATEEDAKLIVDSQMSGTVLGKLVTDLDNHRIEIYTHDGRDIKFVSSVKCLHSLLKSNGVVFESNKNSCVNDFCKDGEVYLPWHAKVKCSICESEQSKVWNKQQTYIFKKV